MFCRFYIFRNDKNSETQVKFNPNLDLFGKKTYLCGCNIDIKDELNMKTSAAMGNLWLYLQSLPKSNKEWLLRKFLDDLQAQDEKTTGRNKRCPNISSGWKTES